MMKISLHSRIQQFPTSSFSKNFFIQRRKFSTVADWETVIGLEIHAHIVAKQKLFSNATCVSSVQAHPNTKVDLMDAALPGSLPVLNRECVVQAVRAGLALGGKVNHWSYFDRKHYFYCDLPHGFQITQYYTPIIQGGKLTIETEDAQQKAIRLSHIQLEIDSGKSSHDQHMDYTLVDLNRAGVGMLEIVTQPDMRSPSEAASFVSKLQELLKHLGVCNANMDEGEFRCDVNVSLKKKGPEHPLGTRCEIKNLNSIRYLVKAIEYEVKRQSAILSEGGTVEKQTRSYDAVNNVTLAARRKEDDVDYRFMSEPDLPPIIIDQSEVEQIKRNMPDLPDTIRKKLVSQMELTVSQVDLLMSNKALDYFYQVQAGARSPKTVATWIVNELLGLLNESAKRFQDNTVSAANLGKLLDLINSGYISGRMGKDVLREMFQGDNREPKAIVDEKGWAQTSDEDLINTLCDKLLAENPKEVLKYKVQKKDRVLRFFVGEVMKSTKGKANPQKVTEIVQAKLHNFQVPEEVQ